ATDMMLARSRRPFLGPSVAVAAHPALGIPASTGVHVIIVGAGPAGIAAARRIIAARRKLAIFEATDRVGGRCFTDTRTFGIPYDRGAHWIDMPDTNPVAKLGLKTGLDIYAAPPRQLLRLGLGTGISRYARDGEWKIFWRTWCAAGAHEVNVARTTSKWRVARDFAPRIRRTNRFVFP